MVRLPAVPAALPAPITPPLLTVTAPADPVPMRVPPELIVVALAVFEPVRLIVPALIVVEPW